MSNETRRYLDLIGEHLKGGHASVLVGAGFSRNAVKVDERLQCSPDWNELAQIFVDQLASTPEEKKPLRQLSPLVLAAVYGRPELDSLLMRSIQDADFLPSTLHRKLLELPWSDIFTTNYDTLLERASEELTERRFTIVACKEDLVGSSGSTRIIKLHGSFPSHRPFIITSEDYRIYPKKFAPFVNTVQQSMLENTLCLIGFSGNDPNFEQWIGWIRDNLGADNTPNIYLLLHNSPTEAEKRLLARRKIIPVDLSQMSNEQEISAIYEIALDYLLEKQQIAVPGKWNLKPLLEILPGQSVPISDALDIVQEIHRTYPGWLTVPEGRLELLRIVTSKAMSLLSEYSGEDNSPTETELIYLYECDWLREKTLLPNTFHELNCYQKILERHPESSFYKYAIQLSPLRNLRECGRWDDWNALYDELQNTGKDLTSEQTHQLRWEGCQGAQAQYHITEFRQRLKTWNVDTNMPIWVLRKAGLLAEIGEIKEAHSLLQPAILEIRRRLLHQNTVDLNLLSLESAMMFLQGYISDALDHSGKLELPLHASKNNIADNQHRAVHHQYHVDWEIQDVSFSVRLEAPWTPYCTQQDQASFDFGKVHRSHTFGADMEVIRAYSFLRFREETGVPFSISSVHSGKKAACGAAERIARYNPLWSILTLVRAGTPKAIERAITRGVLSCWTQEEADQIGTFYLDALLSTEKEMLTAGQFYRESFAYLVADVLPVILSELCAKCSRLILDKMLSALEHLYTSDKKLCYPQTKLFAKRLIASYPSENRQELIEKLLAFSVVENERLLSDFPDPIALIPIIYLHTDQEPKCSIPAIELLFTQYESSTNRKPIIDRLLYCFCHGLLTGKQKLLLRDVLWSDGKHFDADDWLQTICLYLPAPENIDVPQYLAEILANEILNSGERKSWSLSSRGLYNQVKILLEQAPNAFKEAQILAIMQGCSNNLLILSDELNGKAYFMGGQGNSQNEMYEIAHMLWMLTARCDQQIVSDASLEYMRNILEVCQSAKVHHCGLYHVWNQKLGKNFDLAKELSNSFQFTDKLCVKWAFNTLSAGLRYPELSLLGDAVICSSIDLLIQQIVWGVPQLLISALQAVKIAVEYRPELISDYMLEPLITGLSRLVQQTRITTDDTVEAACDKGNIRVNAAALAKTLCDANMYGARPEILKSWLTIMDNQDEFAEIRNILHQRK